MARVIRSYIWIFACMLAVLSVSGCAGRRYLMVDYQVPGASAKLDGQAVRLRVEDRRPAGPILSQEAAGQFPEFGGIYSLAWIMPDQERILAGDHELMGLFKTVFEKRLASQGIRVTDLAGEQVPELAIVLNRFSLDLQNRKWMAALSYHAVLTLKDHPTAKETVHGSAERVRVVGRKGADTVLSDIFSDVINRLDLDKLFRNAELIQ